MVILFTNTKGGVGKSTLAVHLVLFLHDQGRRVALVDSDEQASSSEWVAEAEPGLMVRQARTPESAAEIVLGLQDDHDFVICDAAGDNSETARTLMLLADLAVFPVGPSILDLRSLAKATSLLKYAQRINGGRPAGRLLLNKVKKRDRISRSLPEAARQLGVPLLESSIRDLQAFRDAAQQATSVARMENGAREAKKDIERLFAEMISEVSARPDRIVTKELANG